jgi:hypothetical protein
MGNSPHSASIHILDDDSLLNVLNLYRPFFLGEDEEDDARFVGGRGGWVHGRWWYKLAHICQRWRNLVLESASFLGVSLVCKKGTPVADMLAHSPPLPLVIDYYYEYLDITAEDEGPDEEGIILALKERDRVRCVRLGMPITNLQKLFLAINEEYPILEYLVIVPSIYDSAAMVLPEAIQAPRLRHLALAGFALPIGSRLLATAVGLVTLCLFIDQPSTYFHPNTLLQWLSLMPQLQTLVISFYFPVPNRDVEKQLMHAPTITLPNLHLFRFRGVSAYLEVLLHRITTPRLEKLEIGFFNQLTFSIPRFLQFMMTTENLRFESARFEFFDGLLLHVEAYPRREAETHALSITVHCQDLDWQVSSAAQFSNFLSQMFSAVEHLTIEHKVCTQSSEEHNGIERSEWRKLLNSFSNVKTLHIAEGLIGELSRCLQLDDGELPLELLPELQEITFSGSDNDGNAFTSFIDARKNTGRPVALAHP